MAGHRSVKVKVIERENEQQESQLLNLIYKAIENKKARLARKE